MMRSDHHHPQYPDLLGNFHKSYPMEMIGDRVRTESICEALRRTLRADDVFCELGCGTGIFCLFAAEFCRTVFAIELDPAIASVAAANFNASHLRNKIHLIHDDAMTAQLPGGAKADVVFAEMMSIWTIEEPQVVAMNRARTHLLAPGGRVLPSRIVNLVELGHYSFGVRGVVLKAALPLFTGIPGAALMTERRVAKVLDFTDTVPVDLSATIEFEALISGRLNCAVLRSYVEMGPGVGFSGTDSLMPATIVPLDSEIDVKAGDIVQLRAVARAWTDLGESKFIAHVAR